MGFQDLRNDFEDVAAARLKTIRLPFISSGWSEPLASRLGFRLAFLVGDRGGHAIWLSERSPTV